MGEVDLFARRGRNGVWYSLEDMAIEGASRCSSMRYSVKSDQASLTLGGQQMFNWSSSGKVSIEASN